MRVKHLDLILMVAVSLMNVIWVLLPQHLSIVGTVLALPLVFLLPGYAITEILIHKLSLDFLRRFIFSVGLSLVIDIVAGFIINLFSAGLRGISWSVFLGSLTTILSIFIIYIRRKDSTNNFNLPKWHFQIYKYALIGLSLLIVFLSVRYSAINESQHPHAFFTDLWMQSSKGSDNNCAVRLGVQSFEATSVKYRIIVRENGTQLTMWQSIVLAPQQKWDQLVALSPKSTSIVYVEVKLYKVDEPNIVYRNVHITLTTLVNSNNRKINC